MIKLQKDQIIQKKENIIKENEIKQQKGEPITEILLNSNEENILNDMEEKEIDSYIVLAYQ